MCKAEKQSCLGTLSSAVMSSSHNATHLEDGDHGGDGEEEEDGGNGAWRNGDLLADRPARGELSANSSNEAEHGQPATPS